MTAVDDVGQQRDFATVDAPVFHWARLTPDAVAIDDGTHGLTFAQLAAAVTARAAALRAADAPAIVWVDDGAGIPARLVDFLGIVASGRSAAIGDPDWPPAVREQVMATISTAPATLPAPGPTTAFYVGFTSGSTGLPKGFQRRHRSWTESFRVCIDEFGDGTRTCVLAPGRVSHSLFLFGMLLGVWTGAGVVVQEPFSATRALEAMAQGQTPCLVAVPSQLLLMLALAVRRGLAPMPAVRLIMISGARWMRDRTPALRALFPEARIIEFYGASETSFIAWTDADAAMPPEVVGRPFGNVDLDIRAPDASDGPGLIYVRSPMLFMNYVGAPDATAALRAGEWLSVRDVGYLDDAGRLCLMGRQKRMIVTQGKNLFPEEVEAVLAAHPEVVAASVHGVTDALRGMQVVAAVQRSAGSTLDAAALSAWCRTRLETFKTPRAWFGCAPWPMTASDKTDHAAIAQAFHDLPADRSPAVGGQTAVPETPASTPPTDISPCLHPIR
jgi:acyl-CoA synthetase (AMP-forming)/AMP-acid ligase II